MLKKTSLCKGFWKPDPKAVCQNMAISAQYREPQILLDRKFLCLLKHVWQQNIPVEETSEQLQFLDFFKKSYFFWSVSQ